MKVGYMRVSRREQNPDLQRRALEVAGCERIFGEKAEGLAGKEPAVWLQEKSLTLEYRGEALSRYDVEYVSGADRLEGVGRPRLYETAHAPRNRSYSGSTPSARPGG